ncbi:PEP-CTERM sorting domain-containing protein [Phormidium sp. CLA17]|uniref:amidase family protein n=1 Tax=Leptolyngbya sp. Cla-17 TaxID=2803751 RepID=UPI001491BDB5|nr:amidase family protein [Leptolyngbya sp. Cla-17]MBM0744244.1 PEP-CTERM sorting domain-containing protein [Leptolyngbya sp. Cla-17]
MLKTVKRVAAAIATPALFVAIAPDIARSATFQLLEASIPDINQAFEAKALTSEQLVQLYLNRITAYDEAGPSLNSLITVNPTALAIAKALDLERQTTGPRSILHGIPVIVKDNFDTFDMPTTGGSVTLAGSIPPNDAFVVQQLRDAGAIILGKANLDEWAHGGVPGGGYSAVGGQTLNPYNLLRGPAGSSGGTGAAIAANFGVFGLGSDTGGSIRGPAAANGLVGIKPTLGLTSRDGVIPFALSFDVSGPLAKNVTDAAIALSFMTGIDANDPATAGSAGLFSKDYTQFLTPNALAGARIGVARDFFGGNPDVDAAINSAIGNIQTLGATVVDSVLFPPSVFPLLSATYSTISDTEFKAQLADYLATVGPEFPKTLAEVIAINQSPESANSPTPISPAVLTRLFQAEVRGPLNNPDYLAALSAQGEIKSVVQTILDANNLDALIYPTSRCPAAPRTGIVDPTYSCISGRGASNFANLSGFPDVQVPAGFTTDGLPIALSFLGRAYSEPALLGYAYAFEQATNYREPPESVPELPGEVITYEAVPEPTTVPALLIFGGALLWNKQRKRQKNQSLVLK